MKCSEHCGWLTSPLISFYNWLQIKGRIGLFKENTSPPTSDSPGMGCCRGGMPNFSEKILFFSLNKRDRIPFFVFHLSEYEEKSPFFADSHLSIVVRAILITKGINLFLWIKCGFPALQFFMVAKYQPGLCSHVDTMEGSAFSSLWLNQELQCLLTLGQMLTLSF